MKGKRAPGWTPQEIDDPHGINTELGNPTLLLLIVVMLCVMVAGTLIAPLLDTSWEPVEIDEAVANDGTNVPVCMIAATVVALAIVWVVLQT